MLAQQASQMYQSMSQYKQQLAQYEEWQKKDQQEETVTVKAEHEEGVADSGTSVTNPPVLRHRTEASESPSKDPVLNYFQGTLRRVSCSGKQATFVIGALTLSAPDLHQGSFSGKREFSCGMTGTRVKGFYSAKSSGNQLVALEFEDTEQGK
jgi:hypothetical protein